MKRRGRLPAEECVAIGAALATALEQLHQSKLVHRDIKPSNIIFVHGRPKLADIGLVTDVDASLSFVGTMGYVAPEGPGQPSADTYSLGKVLYEMCTGLNRDKFPALPPLEGMSESERKGLRELNSVILKDCAHDRAQRHRTAGELRDELLRLQIGESIERQRALERAYGRLKVAALWVGPVLLVSALSIGVWSYRGRVALREALLAQARLERQGPRLAGWFTNNWVLIQKAAAIRAGPDTLKQAASALAGMDAEPVCSLRAVGAWAAFGPDGTTLIGGALRSDAAFTDTNEEAVEAAIRARRAVRTPATLIEARRTKTNLSLEAEGPVGWASDGVPLQFSAVSNACWLRDIRTGEVRQQFPLAQGERVTRYHGPVLARTQDGGRVAAAVGGQDHERVVAWDAVTGQMLGGAPLAATALTFSPDGAVLAAGDREGNATIYRALGMVHLAALAPPTRPAPVCCLAMTRDRVLRESDSTKTNWLLAAGYKDGEVVIWDLQRRQPRASCRGSSYTVASLAFDPDGLLLASGGRPEIRLWDAMSGQFLLQIPSGGDGDCRALAFSHDGNRLVWANEAESKAGQASMGVWELKRQRGVQVLRGLLSNTRHVWFSRDNRLLAAVSDDWRVAVWETGSGRLNNIFEVPVGVFAESAGGTFDAHGQRFAFAAGTTAQLYDLATGQVLQRWRLPKSGLYDALRFDRKGRLLLVRRGPDTELAGEKRWRLYELPANENPVLLLEQTETNWVPENTVFAEGGERFFVWGKDTAGAWSVLRAYDVASGGELWQPRLAGPYEPVVHLDPTGRWFAYNAERMERCRVIRLSDFKEFGWSPERCATIGPLGEQFAVWPGDDQGYTICGRDGPAAGLPLGLARESGGESFSPDGRLFAWGTPEGVVLVAELETVRERLASLRLPRR